MRLGRVPPRSGLARKTGVALNESFSVFLNQPATNQPLNCAPGIGVRESRKARRDRSLACIGWF
jgi:hypothetical protein